MPSPFRMIDLFAGCGGLTSGFVSTGGFSPVAAVELDFEASATYAQNFGDHVYVGDVTDWAKGSLPAAEVVVGGPPCQGFSALGRQDPQDPRNQLWQQYVEVLARVKPSFFVIENVPQFLKSPEYAALHKQTRGRGRLAGWVLEPHVLNAADYGAAQARRRAVVIGRRKGTREMGPPKPVLPMRTLKDALGEVPYEAIGIELPQSTVEFQGKPVAGPFKMADLHITRRPTAVSLDRYRAIPYGGSRFDLPDKLQTPGWRRHTSGAGDVMGRLRWERPAVTVRTEFFKPEKGRYLHPEADRPITHLEAALIQGFPEDFLWCGSKVSIARQIGNAVPVPLAAAIAEHLLSRLS